MSIAFDIYPVSGVIWISTYIALSLIAKVKSILSSISRDTDWFQGLQCMKTANEMFLWNDLLAKYLIASYIFPICNKYREDPSGTQVLVVDNIKMN